MVLWQMGLDYEKYLEKHGVIEVDAFDEMFGKPDEEPEPDNPEMNLEQLMAGGADD